MTLRTLTTTGGLRAFRHRNYRLFYAGQGTSLVGTWMQATAQAWLLLELTGDPLYLGLVAVAQFAPVLVLGLFGGLVADALPKRRTLVVAQTLMMTVATTLWVLTATGRVEVWMVLALAFAMGTLNAVEMPVRQSFAIEMVGRSDLPSAVALGAALFNASRIVGPALAGLVIAFIGIPAAFLVNALSFLGVLAALLLMDPSALEPAPQFDRPKSIRGVVDALGEGVAFVRTTAVARLAVLMVGFVATLAMNWNVLVPVFARDVLGTGAAGFGFLMAVTGIGSLVAALWMTFGRGRRLTMIVGGSLLLGLSSIALSATGTYPLAAALLFLSGLGGILMAVSANLTLQLSVPDHLRGRVMSVYTTIFAGTSPIGGLIAGSIASAAGVQVAFLVGGIGATIVALIAAAWLVRYRRAQREAAAGQAAAGQAVARPQPGALPQSVALPRTSAAFSPPKPNEVESTRS
jgi:MFS family permease